ncbi:hypothetical protein [Streptomyces sp. NRRL B-24484]|uniref:hypothetical protein n=1 Tax=Streptomyces sp. NRRL B-24484 TaxID=1463833 RepID=UPI0004C01972|nr:hypothetical protein [Streptomyces sp. NRRL B-24484]
MSRIRQEHRSRIAQFPDYLNVYLRLTAPPGTRIVPELTSADSSFPADPPPGDPTDPADGAAAPPLPLPTTTRGQ